jgi:hypothetical protein
VHRDNVVIGVDNGDDNDVDDNDVVLVDDDDVVDDNDVHIDDYFDVVVIY